MRNSTFCNALGHGDGQRPLDRRTRGRRECPDIAPDPEVEHDVRARRRVADVERQRRRPVRLIGLCARDEETRGELDHARFERGHLDVGLVRLWLWQGQGFVFSLLMIVGHDSHLYHLWTPMPTTYVEYIMTYLGKYRTLVRSRTSEVLSRFPT